mgnify:CR=1 FL=1
MQTTASPSVKDGIYTVISPKGGHRTFRVRTQPDDSNFLPGNQVLALLVGPDNSNDYVQFGMLRPNGRFHCFRNRRGTEYEKLGQMVEALLVNPAAGDRLRDAGYGVQESLRCFRCFRLLTTPESLERGYGPECWEKLGGVS